MTTRRDFIRDAAWVAVPLVGGCRTFGDGEPLVRFGLVTDVHHADLPRELRDSRINEGAFFVRSPDGKRFFVVYSGNGCWCDDYAMRKSNPNRKPTKRWLNFQRVTFDPSGYPQIGVAIGVARQRASRR